jgi:hypothetical protein
MAEINIQKVKLIKKDHLEISYSTAEATIKEERDTPVHPDLKDALSKLAPHLACITEYVSNKTIGSEEVQKFTATGFSLGGDDDDEGFVITGYRTLKNGKTVTLNTPFTRFEELPETAYYFIDDVREKIDVIKEEVLAYIAGEKKAPEPQLSLDLPEENKVTHAQIAEPENNGTGTEETEEDKPKKKRKKKETAIQIPE